MRYGRFRLIAIPRERKGVKFQDAEKVNSQKRSEIPISAEEIATPSLKRPHRILPETRNPFADPNGAPGENRPS